MAIILSMAIIVSEMATVCQKDYPRITYKVDTESELYTFSDESTKLFHMHRIDHTLHLTCDEISWKKLSSLTKALQLACDNSFDCFIS